MYLHRGYGVGIHRYLLGDAMKITHNVIFNDKSHTVLTREQRYAIGLIKPNHPMPAIRYEWDMGMNADGTLYCVPFELHSDFDATLELLDYQLT